MKQHQVSSEIAISAENLDTGQLNVAQEEKAKEERMEKTQEKERNQKAETKQLLPSSHRQRSRNLWIKIGYVQPSGATTARRGKHVSFLMQHSY